MCSGTQGSKWSDHDNQCVQGTPGSFCDSTRRETCYVGRFEQMPEFNYTLAELIEAGNLPSAAIKWDLQPGVAASLVEYVGAEWEADGLRIGDRIISIGNNLVTEEMLSNWHVISCDMDVTVARGPVVVTLTLCGKQ